MDITFSKHVQTKDNLFEFTILIPTWNNLEILKLCLKSILQNSQIKIQIIVIVNEGKDGTSAWMQTQAHLDYIIAEKNIGICYGLNIARSLIKAEYVVYANDDMYFLPGWDTSLKDEINRIGHNRFLLSATMIEPEYTGNPCVSIGNYGNTIATFQEDRLLNTYHDHMKADWKGSSWPPSVMHIDYWDLIGGYSIEFSPGMYSDPDISMKLYITGVRYFKGIGSSLVYHFGSKSTKRVRKNKGRKTFIAKWGISAHDFYDNYLQLGEKWDNINFSAQADMKPLTWKQKLKRAFYALKV